MKIYYSIFILLAFSVISCQDILFEEEPANDPIGNFESLWKTFNEKYAVFEQRGVDWQVFHGVKSRRLLRWRLGYHRACVDHPVQRLF